MSLFFVNCRAHSRADGFCCDLLQQAPQIISFLKLCLVDRNNQGISSTLKSVRWRTSNFLKSIIVQLISIWSGGLRMSWLFYSTNDTTFAFAVVASFVIFHIDHPLKSFGRKTSNLHVSSPFATAAGDSVGQLDHHATTHITSKPIAQCRIRKTTGAHWFCKKQHACVLHGNESKNTNNTTFSITIYTSMTRVLIWCWPICKRSCPQWTPPTARTRLPIMSVLRGIKGQIGRNHLYQTQYRQYYVSRCRITATLIEIVTCAQTCDWLDRNIDVIVIIKGNLLFLPIFIA